MNYNFTTREDDLHALFMSLFPLASELALTTADYVSFLPYRVPSSGGELLREMTMVTVTVMAQ